MSLTHLRPDMLTSAINSYAVTMTSGTQCQATERKLAESQMPTMEIKVGI